LRSARGSSAKAKSGRCEVSGSRCRSWQGQKDFGRIPTWDSSKSFATPKPLEESENQTPPNRLSRRQSGRPAIGHGAAASVGGNLSGASIAHLVRSSGHA
jgi:hypothetical protein